MIRDSGSAIRDKGLRALLFLAVFIVFACYPRGRASRCRRGMCRLEGKATSSNIRCLESRSDQGRRRGDRGDVENGRQVSGRGEPGTYHVAISSRGSRRSTRSDGGRRAVQPDRGLRTVARASRSRAAAPRPQAPRGGTPQARNQPAAERSPCNSFRRARSSPRRPTATPKRRRVNCRRDSRPTARSGSRVLGNITSIAA